MEFFLNQTPLLYLTQSLWRDEAFSVLFSQKPLLSLFNVTFEPPFYYILLHFWMKLFGTGEIVVRSLSLLGYLLACSIVIIWCRKLFKNHWLAWFAPVFFALNPMILYYAFEGRAYGWYICFAIAALYGYTQRKWVFYTAATILGLYTHTYFVFIPVIVIIHYVLIDKNFLRLRSIGKIFRDSMVRAHILIGIAYSPWIIKTLSEAYRLKESWYFPINARLVKSIFANLFLGFEGTPDMLWQYTPAISVCLFVFFLYAMKVKKFRSRNSLFFLLLFIPLAAILGISVYKPIYVNRYMLASAISEVFLIIFAIENIRNTRIQKITAIAMLSFVIGFNLWYPSQNKKKDIRSTIVQINSLMNSRDVLLVDDALLLFEAKYYSADPSRVYWYNPKAELFPWYIGDAIYSPSQTVSELPPYPIRAYIVHLDGSYEISYNAQTRYASGRN